MHAVQKGYRNESFAAELPDGRTLNLILYKREPEIVRRIRNANYVSDFLAGQGFAARATADPRIVQARAGEFVRYAALYHFLPGTTIPWETYTMAHIKQLGAALSDMHALLGPLPRDDLPLVAEECAALAGRMRRYFGEPGVQKAMAAKLTLSPPVISFDFDHYRQLPGQQALHMDFVRGNILFSETEKARITGVLDFEKAAWGHPVFDIARTLAFLLVDCKYKEAEKVCKYFLHSGYNKRGRSHFGNSALLEPLVNFFLTYDFYKFLRHNPYQSLRENEHFVRTRDFLLKRNIIAQTGMLQ